jgi:Flp pilus assembly pilin Flp
MFEIIIKDQRGAIFAEYGLLATLIAVACVAAATALGVSALGQFDSGGLLEALRL